MGEFVGDQSAALMFFCLLGNMLILHVVGLLGTDTKVRRDGQSFVLAVHR